MHCAIAIRITRLHSLVVVAIRITRLAQPMSVVLAVAILPARYVCQPAEVVVVAAVVAALSLLIAPMELFPTMTPMHAARIRRHTLIAETRFPKPAALSNSRIPAAAHLS
jgi:hypothetical protein